MHINARRRRLPRQDRAAPRRAATRRRCSSSTSRRPASRATSSRCRPTSRSPSSGACSPAQQPRPHERRAGDGVRLGRLRARGLSRRCASCATRAAELGIGEIVELVPRAADPKNLFGVLHDEPKQLAARPAAARAPHDGNRLIPDRRRPTGARLARHVRASTGPRHERTPPFCRAARTSPAPSALTPALMSSPLREAIRALTRTPEPELLPGLIEQARLTPAPGRGRRRRWRCASRAACARRSRAGGRAGLVQGLLQEFALSSQEGVALMCLAEALLRIPDAATRDALIRDKIGDGDWQRASRPQPLAVRQRRDLGPAGHRQARRHPQRQRPGRRAAPPDRARRRAADPQGRRHGHAHDGRAVRHRRDHRRGAASARARAKRRASAIPTTCWARRRLTAADAAALFRRLRARDPCHRQGVGRPRASIDGPGISVKLSALHPRYARAQAARVMAELLPRADAAGAAGHAATTSASTSTPRRPTGSSCRSTCWKRCASSPRWPAGTASASSSRPIRSAARP